MIAATNGQLSPYFYPGIHISIWLMSSTAVTTYCTVTLAGPEEFEGVFIQVRDASDAVRGKFVTPQAGFKLSNCFGANDTFSHANGLSKEKNVTARWLSPHDCNGVYTIRWILTPLYHFNRSFSVFVFCGLLRTCSRSFYFLLKRV